MALIKCPECGKTVSSSAEVCIHCGYPIAARIGEPATTDLVPVEAAANRPRRKKALLIVLIAAAVLAVCAALYVFVVSPMYIPKSVADMPFRVGFGTNDSADCFFTGTTLNGIPQGSGAYRIGNGADAWAFEGVVDEAGRLLDGHAEHMPVTLRAGEQAYGGRYTGAIEAGKTSASGAFTVEGKDAVWTYGGSVDENGLLQKGDVQDYPYQLIFDSREYDGIYTGGVALGVPDGNGDFAYEADDEYFKYSGGWLQGGLNGVGTLKSNAIVVHFPEADREGVYDGGMLDGQFSGTGSFSSVNDKGVSYVYTGEWANGLWGGQGKQVFEDDDYSDRVGNFDKYGFHPTVLEFFESFGTAKRSEYEVRKKAKDFITKHTGLFTRNSSEGMEEYIDSTFSFSDFTKNPAIYGDALFKISGLYVFQVIENDDFWGWTRTFFLANDSRGNIYCGTLLGKSDRIVEGERITLCALPLDYATYEGADKTDYWALQFAAVYVE